MLFLQDFQVQWKKHIGQTAKSALIGVFSRGNPHSCDQQSFGNQDFAGRGCRTLCVYGAQPKVPMSCCCLQLAGRFDCSKAVELRASVLSNPRETQSRKPKSPAPNLAQLNSDAAKKLALRQINTEWELAPG